jgi:hypothetical protein
MPVSKSTLSLIIQIKDSYQQTTSLTLRTTKLMVVAIKKKEMIKEIKNLRIFNRKHLVIVKEQDHFH